MGTATQFEQDTSRDNIDYERIGAGLMRLMERQEQKARREERQKSAVQKEAWPKAVARPWKKDRQKDSTTLANHVANWVRFFCVRLIQVPQSTLMLMSWRCRRRASALVRKPWAEGMQVS